MKVVINRCFGGFGLSEKAFEALVARGWTVTTYNGDGYADESRDLVYDPKPTGGSGKYYWCKRRGDDPETRSHPDLVAVVEELGKDAWGQSSKLKVIDIPFDRCEGWEIDDYDGQEKIVQTHASWS